MARVDPPRETLGTGTAYWRWLYRFWASVQGSLGRSVTASATLTENDSLVLADTSSADITITLPLITNPKDYTIVKIAAANTLTINPTSPNTISGDTTLAVTIQWTAITVRASSSGWIII